MHNQCPAVVRPPSPRPCCRAPCSSNGRVHGATVHRRIQLTHIPPVRRLYLCHALSHISPFADSISEPLSATCQHLFSSRFLPTLSWRVPPPGVSPPGGFGGKAWVGNVRLPPAAVHHGYTWASEWEQELKRGPCSEGSPPPWAIRW